MLKKILFIEIFFIDILWIIILQFQLPLHRGHCLFVFVSLNLVVVVGQGSLLLPRGRDQAHAFEEEES